MATAAYHRAWKAKHKDRLNREWRERYANDEEFRDKTKARMLARYHSNEAYRMKENRRKRPDHKHKNGDHFQRSYGISVSDRDAIIESQSGLCPGCVKALGTLPKKKVHVDHDHDTNKVRGVLCHGCNVALGFVSEDPATLRRLADYLERHK